MDKIDKKEDTNFKYIQKQFNEVKGDLKAFKGDVDRRVVEVNDIKAVKDDVKAVKDHVDRRFDETKAFARNRPCTGLSSVWPSRSDQVFSRSDLCNRFGPKAHLPLSQMDCRPITAISVPPLGLWKRQICKPDFWLEIGVEGQELHVWNRLFSRSNATKHFAGAQSEPVDDSMPDPSAIWLPLQVNIPYCSAPQTWRLLAAFPQYQYWEEPPGPFPRRVGRGVEEQIVTSSQQI